MTNQSTFNPARRIDDIIVAGTDAGLHPSLRTAAAHVMSTSNAATLNDRFILDRITSASTPTDWEDIIELCEPDLNKHWSDAAPNFMWEAIYLKTRDLGIPTSFKPFVTYLELQEVLNLILMIAQIEHRSLSKMILHRIGFLWLLRKTARGLAYVAGLILKGENALQP